MKSLICQKCKKRKPIKMFDKDKNRKSRYNAWCKDCKKQWVEDNRGACKANKHEYYRNNIEYFRTKSAEYRKTHKKEIANTGRAYRKKHGKEIYDRIKRSGQKQAKEAAHYAVRSGKLPDLKVDYVVCCDCGKSRATQWEHRDYNKRLQVDPVCQSCNLLRGPAKEMNPKNFENKKCKVCGTKLLWYNKSGLCREHFAKKRKICL